MLYPVSYTHLDVYKRQVVSDAVNGDNFAFLELSKKLPVDRNAYLDDQSICFIGVCLYVGVTDLFGEVNLIVGMPLL